jgi:uncharacterized repeat protein (TIGR03803 family)
VPVTGGNIEVLHQFDPIVPGTSTTDPSTGVVTTTPDTNTEGGYPVGGMIVNGGTLYGTTSILGPNGVGTVFSIATDGSTFTVLRAFNVTDGATPTGNLILTNDGMLAGTTQFGGTLPTDDTGQPVAGAAAGTVYKLSLDGATYSEQCVFNAANSPALGFTPIGGVVQTADGNYYGTTTTGGLYSYGLIYKCGTQYGGGVIGIRPFVDQKSGALPTWLLVLLTSLLGLRLIRQRPELNLLTRNR